MPRRYRSSRVHASGASKRISSVFDRHVKRSSGHSDPSYNAYWESFAKAYGTTIGSIHSAAISGASRQYIWISTCHPYRPYPDYKYEYNSEHPLDDEHDEWVASSWWKCRHVYHSAYHIDKQKRLVQHREQAI